MSSPSPLGASVRSLSFPRSIVLKDLVAIDSQAKDMVNPAQGLLNMNKYRNLWRVFCGIRSSQITPPLLTPNLDRMRVLRVSS